MTDEQTKQAILGFAEFFKGITGNQNLEIPSEIAEKCGIQAQADGEKSFKMRDATPEERELIDKYIKSISKPTGVDFWDLEQEPCEDAISRKSIKHKLQEHHDFFVNSYGGFSNLPQNDKSRVDEISNCIAMVVNEPPVKPQEPKWIPVSEKLPEIHQDIIMSLRSLDIVIGFRAEMEPYFYCHGCYIEPQNVLAWQPLPEPYKAGSEVK